MTDTAKDLATCPKCGSRYAGVDERDHWSWHCGSSVDDRGQLYRGIVCKKRTGDLTYSGGGSYGG